ncbi:MAG: hypothetical protein H6974_09150 [Gammaproteobacteria bacterium]|nr:hypothetical protein [Gammaproteobacteria bacterium]
MNGLLVAGGAAIYQEADTDWRVTANAEAPKLPVSSRRLAGTQRFASLSGAPRNPVSPLDGQPVNPHRPMTGEPLNNCIALKCIQP